MFKSLKARRFRFLLSAVVVSSLVACSGDDGSQGGKGEQGAAGPAGEPGIAGANGIPGHVTDIDVVKTHANMAFAVYSDALITAQALHQSLEALVELPSQTTFIEAKEAWLAAREPYGQSEIYRFQEGPIDTLNDDGSLGDDGDGPEGRINAWPLGEALIDYVANQIDGDSGPEVPDSVAGVADNIIADAENFPLLSKDTLKALFSNETLAGDERNVVTGYHAIEFLLWGQDLNVDGSGSGARDNSAGQRPWSDYHNVTGECTSGEGNAALDTVCTRRGEFLLAASELLVEDLQSVVDAWNPVTEGNYYASFTRADNAAASLAGMFEAMGRLGFGELAGERTNIALLNDSQEDEHSCFSDNTHRDIVLNAKGIQNSFLGVYQRIDGSVFEGAGVDDYLISKGEVDLANQLRAAYEATAIRTLVIDAEAKAGTPFDLQLQILSKQVQIRAVVSALSQQTEILEAALAALDITVGDLRQDTEEEI